MTTQIDTPKQNSYQRWVKPRLQNDHEFREKYISRIVECTKHRLLNDEEFKAKHNESNRITQKKKYDTDPEYREWKKEQSRIYQQKKRLLKLQQQNS